MSGGTKVWLVIGLSLLFKVSVAIGQCEPEWRLGENWWSVDGMYCAMAWAPPGPEPERWVIGGSYLGWGVDGYIRSLAWWNGSQWAPFGDGFESGQVYALTEFRGDLVVGGRFRIADGTEGLVATWDGEAIHVIDAQFEAQRSPRIHAMTFFDDQLIVGGEFTSVNGQLVNHIAAWDGQEWHSLGEGVSGEVLALCVLDDRLIVGGSFNRAGREWVRGIAAWDGMEWISLDSPFASSVSALHVDPEGMLIAGDALGNVRSWDGIRWSTLGAGQLEGEVRSLVMFNGFLHAGGELQVDENGEPQSHAVARWNGNVWSGIAPSDAGHRLRDLAVFGEELVAVDPFEIGGERLGPLPSWNGTVWRPWQTGFNESVYTFFEHEGDLFAGGKFTWYADKYTSSVAKWTGTEWQKTGDPGIVRGVETLGTFDGQLVAGGAFTSVNEVPGKHVALWDGDTWTVPGDDLNGGSYPGTAVLAVQEFDEHLYIAGRFSDAGGDQLNNIAYLDQSNWLPLRSGVNGPVRALAVFRGDLIVGGGFTMAGDVPTDGLARWDGQQWHQWGTGVQQSINDLDIFDGELYAAGSIEMIDGRQVRGIARWDGSQWSDVGGGLYRANNSQRVFDLQVTDDELIVVGQFSAAGTVLTQNIARWDGQIWRGHRVNGISARPGHIAVMDDGLLLAGSFRYRNPPRYSSHLLHYSCPPCQADLNGDGIVNTEDFLVFLERYNAHDPDADFNNDGIINTLDFVAFLNAFNQGC